MANWPARVAAYLTRIITKNLKPNRPYFYLADGVALTQLGSGHFIYVDPLEESVCSHLIAHGRWEPWIHKVVLDLVRPGDSVVEVGGHVGFYTLGIAEKVGATGSVLTFEANPRLAALASRSLRFNGYSAWARVVQQAVSNVSGTLSFSLSRRYGGGGHIYIGDNPFGEDSQVIEVEAVRLDDLDLGLVRLLRIDAEGSEALILDGARFLLSQTEIVVCMEWDLIQLRSRSDPEALIASLVEMGFKFWRITTASTIIPTSPLEMMSLQACDVLVSRETPEAYPPAQVK